MTDQARPAPPIVGDTGFHEPAAPIAEPDGLWRRQRYISLTVYWGLHVLCVPALLMGASAGDLALCFGLLFVRMFGITAGYHRYFAHRTYKTSRAFQLFLAVLGTTAVQKGPLWWSSTHRLHHRYSDKPGDPHSPRDGVWYAHQGWVFDEQWGDTRLDWIRDFSRYPELVLLNQWAVAVPALMAAALFVFGGASAFLWGFAVSTVLLWHFTYCVNSVTHIWGTRRYDTDDTSRNNLLVALFTLGEGWHNNHHHYMTATRQGFRWWEIDVTYYILRGLAAVGLVWELREPPDYVVRGEIRKAA